MEYWRVGLPEMPQDRLWLSVEISECSCCRCWGGFGNTLCIVWAVDMSQWLGSGTFSIARTSSVTGTSSSLSPGACWHSSYSAVPASISLPSPCPTHVPVSRPPWSHPPCNHLGSAGRNNQQRSRAEHRGGGGGGGGGVSRQDKGEFKAVFPLSLGILCATALENSLV